MFSYYKFMFPEKKVFNLRIWFFIHRPFMLSSLVLTFSGVFVILGDLNWKWIDPRRQTEFTHSIFGILTLCLSFLQVLLF